MTADRSSGSAWPAAAAAAAAPRRRRSPFSLAMTLNEDNVWDVLYPMIESNPVIWDKSQPNHKKTLVVNHHWKTILRNLRSHFGEDALTLHKVNTLSGLKAKFKNKRDHRIKQRKTIKRLTASGKLPRVKIDPRLSFLDLDHSDEADGDYDPPMDGEQAGEFSQGFSDTVYNDDDDEEDVKEFVSEGEHEQDLFPRPNDANAHAADADGDDLESLAPPSTSTFDPLRGNLAYQSSQEVNRAIISLCKTFEKRQKLDHLDHLFEYVKFKFRKIDPARQGEVMAKILKIIEDSAVDDKKK